LRELTDPAFATLLEPPVAFACTHQFSEIGPLSAEERSYLIDATSQRYVEFATGRRCAISALKSLGIDTPSLGRRRERLPAWPKGTLGSITHCEGLCAAAVSLTKVTRFLAIDAEPNESLPSGVLERIGLPNEVEQLKLLGTKEHLHCSLDRVLFSAKESVFKALYPEVNIYFGFEDVEIEFEAGAERFSAQLSELLQTLTGIARMQGTFVFTPAHVMTAVHYHAG
jgi:4'-phosphopantetheinyl transferase EntD